MLEDINEVVKDIKTRGGSFSASKKERELERLQCLVSDAWLAILVE